MRAFTISQFSYCPLVWMFHSKRLGKKTSTLHERGFIITNGDKSCSFNELLEKDKSVSIHRKKLASSSKRNVQSIQYLTIFLYQGLPLITCLTQLVLKCEKWTLSTFPCILCK